MGRSRCTYCAMRGGSSVLLLSAAVAHPRRLGQRQGCFWAHISCNINFGDKSKGSMKVNWHTSWKFLTTFHVTPTKTVFYFFNCGRAYLTAAA
eukprot:COSAG01_NODE_50_length_31487_cov_90.470243_17_plen_93_part_00